MAQCKFCLPTGEKCRQTQVNEDGLCKWHGKIPVASEGLKEELEKKVKAGESLAGFNLRGADLHDIYLIRADLKYADLAHANLHRAHMYGSDLEGADLFKSNLNKANLKAVNFKDTNLLAVNFDSTKLEGARWNPDYVIINEQKALAAWKKGRRADARDKYKEAEEIYRNIKLAHRQLGHSKDQSPFFYREMVVHRKQMPCFSPRRFASKIMDVTTGYGEKPLSVFWTSVGLVLLSAFFYGIFGVHDKDQMLSFTQHNGSLLSTIGNLIYFSSIVFTTTGFGEVLPFGHSKFVATIEAFSGQILIAFMVVCIYKKLMER